MWVYFGALYSASLIYVPVFVPVPPYFDNCTCILYSEARECDNLQLYSFLLRFIFAIQGLFLIYLNFKIICSSSMKNVMGTLIEIALNMYTKSSIYEQIPL